VHWMPQGSRRQAERPRGSLERHLEREGDRAGRHEATERYPRAPLDDPSFIDPMRNERAGLEVQMPAPRRDIRNEMRLEGIHGLGDGRRRRKEELEARRNRDASLVVGKQVAETAEL